MAGLVLGLTLMTVPAFADLTYVTAITGATDSDLADLLDQVSQLKSLEDRHPASVDALHWRAEEDTQRLLTAAHSLGYWGARLSYRIDETTQPAKVTVTVKQGPLYHVAVITVLAPDGKPLAIPRRAEARPLPLKPGDPARSEPVVATENALLAAFGQAGYPFAKAVRRRVVIDRGSNTMRIAYVINPGARLRFGPAAITGLRTLDKGYVERRLDWRPGMLYDNRKVAETRKRLVASGLFSAVQITPVRDPADPQRVHMDVAVTESAHRSVGVGVAYNTTEGAGARAFWENRNLFGNAEHLRLTLSGGQQQVAARANFRRPDFLATDQDLLALAEIADETPAAYHSRRAQVTTGLQRHFGPHLTGGVSLSLEKANVVQLADVSTITASQRSQHYALAGAPLYLKYDDTDSLLNPTRGFRVQFNTVPYQSFSGPNLAFMSSRLSASAYRRLDSSNRVVFAGLVSMSSIEGPSLARLPADKRIYAGGGGSIRAYGYQMAGPLDVNHKPIGGKSALELSLEARIRVSKTIGIVPFIDAGSYYEKSLPQLGHRLLYGPGLGVRYYTPFGPIRLDVATPLNRRPGDSFLQVYISLGQAF